MKLSRMVGASLLAVFVRDSAAGAGPGIPGIIDRPTPPACCADGICYPNATTWGTYPTRWRRWPGEILAPTPAEGMVPTPPTPDLPPFVTPPKEEEERRAPPPTPAPERETPEADREITVPPTTPPAATPEATPMTPPDRFEPPTRFPFDDDETTEPQDTLPFGRLDPKGNDDPPPAPPFRIPPVARSSISRSAERPRPDAVPRATIPSPPPDTDDDPPPAFPLTLG